MHPIPSEARKHGDMERGTHTGVNRETSGTGLHFSWVDGTESLCELWGYFSILTERQSQLPTMPRQMESLSFVPSPSDGEPTHAWNDDLDLRKTNARQADWPNKLASSDSPLLIELAVDASEDLEQRLLPILTSRLSPELVDSVRDLFVGVPKDPTIRAPELVDGWTVVDLYIPTVADRASDFEIKLEDKDGRLDRCVRRLRIAQFGRCSVMLWFPRETDMDTSWDAEGQLGRYQGIAPLRDRDTWGNELIEHRMINVREQVQRSLLFLHAASINWTRQLTRTLERGTTVFAQLEQNHKQLQESLASLGSTTSMIEVTFLVNQLRLREFQSSWREDFLAGFDSALQEQRMQYSANVTQLSTLAMGSQDALREEESRAAEEERKKQRKRLQEESRDRERLQVALTYVTAFVLLPTLVVGVFGSNIELLASGAKAQLLDVIAWSVAAATLTLALVQPTKTKLLASIAGLSVVSLSVFSVVTQSFSPWVGSALVIIISSIPIQFLVRRKITTADGSEPA